MAKSDATHRVGKGERGGGGKFTTTSLYVGAGEALPEGATGFKVKVPSLASRVLSAEPQRIKALVQGYGEALAKSRSTGRIVSFRVDVGPDGDTYVTPVDAPILARMAAPVEEVAELDPELPAALAATRERGRLLAAEIFRSEDMLSAEEFAKMLGTSRVTVNTKRQAGQVLGLDGAKRGFKFPAWQLDNDGKPYAELSLLHDRLGGPWAVYRFLVRTHGELDGRTGREALARGEIDAVRSAAESVGRDFQ